MRWQTETAGDIPAVYLGAAAEGTPLAKSKPEMQAATTQ